MSMKLSLLANYTSQIYVTLVGLVAIPFYIDILGAESYGLVGFFSMMQAMFALLDFGLTPTVSREAARYRGAAVTSTDFLKFVRALMVLFVIISLFGALLIVNLADTISQSWLNYEELSIEEVVFAVQVMGLSVALRWMGGLYRGLITGYERITWLSLFNIVLSTLRFLGVIPILWWFGENVRVFFSYQLLIAFLEFLALYLYSRTLLPFIDQDEKIGWSIRPVYAKLKFSLGVAFSSGLWVFVTQTDKLIISKILTLTEYGYFTMAVLVASGISMLSAPIGVVVRPRLAKLYAEGKEKEMISLYREFSQLAAVISFSIAVSLAVLSKPVLFLWTGDMAVVENAWMTLSLYSLGFGVLAVSAFPFFLQFAKGDLKLHLVGSVLFVVVLVPLFIFLINKYGVVGAGVAWLSVHFAFLLLWLPIVHRSLYKGLHTQWLLKDIGPPILILLIVGWSSFGYIDIDADGKLSMFAKVVAQGLMFVIIASAFSRALRRRIFTVWVFSKR